MLASPTEPRATTHHEPALLQTQTQTHLHQPIHAPVALHLHQLLRQRCKKPARAKLIQQQSQVAAVPRRHPKRHLFVALALALLHRSRSSILAPPLGVPDGAALSSVKTIKTLSSLKTRKTAFSFHHVRRRPSKSRNRPSRWHHSLPRRRNRAF